MGELGIAVERQDGVTRLDVAGELDLATAPALREAVAGLLAAGEALTLVLELSGVSFLDSSGLGALLQARAEVRPPAARTSARTFGIEG